MARESREWKRLCWKPRSTKECVLEEEDEMEEEEVEKEVNKKKKKHSKCIAYNLNVAALQIRKNRL